MCLSPTTMVLGDVGFAGGCTLLLPLPLSFTLARGVRMALLTHRSSIAAQQNARTNSSNCRVPA